uniref:Uncharacterized protein n=1 Tax=Coccidioides posadasii RMSCC 3488 TaxID=454284 RepID=A0A0J6FJN9_COCPO|nr:hypothetical protein CPAG_05910 [Coccidioides posadasii RMSCC 3488]
MAERRGDRDRIRSAHSRAKSDRSTMPGNLVSPPGSNTPPTGRTKSNALHSASEPVRFRSRHGSEPINAGALAKALQDFENVGRQRERTPGSSPCRKRQRVYGDRYVLAGGPPMFVSALAETTTARRKGDGGGGGQTSF